MSLQSPCLSCCDPADCPTVDGLRVAINALMLERRTLRAYAAALGMSMPHSRRHELAQELLRMEREARRACRAAGIELRNNDQPFVEAV